MKKRLLLPLLLCLVIIAGTVIPAAARESRAGESVKVTVFIDGRHIQLKVPPVIINSVTCVQLGALSRALGASKVTWDGTRSVVYAKGLEISAAAGESYIIANGRYLYAPAHCRVIDGELIVPVRTLAKAFGAQVDWVNATRTVSVSSGGTPIKSGDDFYSNDDVLWLSRIIHAEARGESLRGKIAVGNVIMNRLNSPWHPDSVYGVIFDKRSGIQFTPAYSGAIYNKPSEESVIAAKLALDGADVVGGSLYFSQRSLSCWAARNRKLAATIGNHSFYL